MSNSDSFRARFDLENNTQNSSLASILRRLLARVIDLLVVYLLASGLSILIFGLLAISQPEKIKIYSNYVRANNLTSWENLQKNLSRSSLIIDCPDTTDESCLVTKEYLLSQILILSASLLLVHIFYFCAITKSNLANTFGKYWLGIQIVDQTGKTPSLIQLVTREIFFILWYISMILVIFWPQLVLVENLLTFLILISVFKGSLSKDKITLHDQLAYTKVVKI